MQTEKSLLTFLYLLIIPLQFIRPNPCDLSFLLSTIVFLSKIWLAVSALMPIPVSFTDISTKSGLSQADIDTVPFGGVNFRAFSASVFSMNKVSTLSAFTVDCVLSIFNVMPFSWKPILDFATISNTCCNGKLSMCRESSPCCSWIHCVSTLL